jgi:PTH1 family peptidyl-tRNA hydrolase
MKVIVGLGNPGSEYERTRHNAGFMVLDRLASRHGLGGAKTKFHAGAIEGIVAGQRCVLLQPMTYMNRSGLTVGEAVTFYKLEPSDLLIVVDDVAIPTGKIRLRKEGGAGGHNGLADIARSLGNQAYHRLRVGIDSPPGRMPLHDYVLGKFSEPQIDALGPAIDKACDAVECWMNDGIDAAMNRFNPEEK